MGQKLTKAPRGDYDAIVYIDGSEVIAEDSNGRKIASGVAGTDDGSIINTAISLGAKVISLGPHMFSLETGILISSPCTVQGSGIRKTYLVPTRSDIDAITASSATVIRDVCLRDFTVGDGVSVVGHDGIVFDHVAQSAIDRVEIYKMGNNGIYIDYGWQHRLNSVTASYNSAVGILCGPDVENGLQMQQSGSQTSGLENLKILGGSSHSIIGCHFEYGSHGIYASGIVDSEFIANKIYSFTAAGIHLSGSACGVLNNDIKAITGTPSGIIFDNCIRAHAENNHCYVPGIAFIETSSVYTGTLNHLIGNIMAGTLQSVDVDNLSAANLFVANDFRGIVTHIHSDSNHFVYNIGISPSSIFAPFNIVVGNRGYIMRGEPRFISRSLTAGNANAIAFAWHNPEAQDILIKKVTVRITTPGGTAGSLLDVGIADDATGTNLGAEFFDDLDLNTAGTSDQDITAVFCQDSASATDGWVVGKILAQNAGSLVGSYYIEYMGA